MAAVRDPAFWRRFSMAVHIDEEKSVPRTDTEKSETSKKSVTVTSQHTYDTSHLECKRDQS